MHSIRSDTVVGGIIKVNDIVLRSVNIDKEFSITGLVDSFNLFENVFTNTLTGNLQIGDTANLISNFPIVGHEEIVITM